MWLQHMTNMDGKRNKKNRQKMETIEHNRGMKGHIKGLIKALKYQGYQK